MCSIYSRQDPDRYALTTRSLRLEGYSTSIRLENAFWEVLERMAASEGRALSDLIAELHREVESRREGPMNFSSILRASCLIFLENHDQGRSGSVAA
ncbi:ribbon-helix-helix domain-containing protein [Oceaniglobus roseus]|uniref:ribbon-helix-helix domain-containing protein n=1 Tax=Oceaniglobus roseus TaxID=1737570 RepID=UPI000C7F6AD0|nr:ribbon-helix-helix domain-containing protein [Kandeliimicrobium roseum]